MRGERSLPWHVRKYVNNDPFRAHACNRLPSCITLRKRRLLQRNAIEERFEQFQPFRWLVLGDCVARALQEAEVVIFVVIFIVIFELSGISFSDLAFA